LPDWTDLLPEDRTWFTSEVDTLKVDAPKKLAGLRQLIAHEYSLNYPSENWKLTLASALPKASRPRKTRGTWNGTPPEPPERLRQTWAGSSECSTPLSQLDVLGLQISRISAEDSLTPAGTD